MPDGDGGIRRQVDRRLHGEEAVDLPLRTKLGGEGRHVHRRRLGVGDLVVVVHHVGVSF